MDTDAEVNRADVLAHLLSKDPNQPREEPKIAANIGEQLTHMGLDGWTLSVLRRIRDGIGRLQPLRVLEVGASIGHRSAWFFDAMTRFDQPVSAYTMVEQGNKFAVILHRLRTRYEAEGWASIVVGEPNQLAAEHRAWMMASATGIEAANTPFEEQYEAIVIDGPHHLRASHVGTYLAMLAPNGVLFTTEPHHPTGDVEEDDLEGMKLVTGFNEWIDLVKSTQVSHHVAFMPVFGGTVVAWMPKVNPLTTDQ